MTTRTFTWFSSSLDMLFNKHSHVSPNQNHWNFFKMPGFLINIWLLEIFLNILVKNWNLLCTWISVQENLDATLVSTLWSNCATKPTIIIPNAWNTIIFLMLWLIWWCINSVIIRISEIVTISWKWNTTLSGVTTRILEIVSCNHNSESQNKSLSKKRGVWYAWCIFNECWTRFKC